MIEANDPKLINGQDQVLIKPDLLQPAESRQAILTHPLVVKAVVEYVLEKGGRPLVADSPAAGKFNKIVETGGYKEALKGLDVECREFKKTVPVDMGEPFGVIDIAKEAIEADVVVNLPKLKSHAHMLLSLGLKNLFGCVVGLKKAECHSQVGIDRALFAKLLVRIYKAVRPGITIIDGILAMEGQGPGKGGVPRSLGQLVSGRNAVATDVVICSMLGIEPEQLPTNREAMASGEVDTALYVNGDINIINDFKFPDPGDFMDGQRSLSRFVRKHMLQRPVVNNEACRFCGTCWVCCPGKAISWSRENVTFDYDKCIRCYCCIEACPEGVIHAEEPLPGKLMRRFTGHGQSVNA